MKKLLAVMAVVGLVAVGAWAGATWYFGVRAERQYRGVVEQLARSASAQVTVESYDRGFFGAKVRTLVSIPLPAPLAMGAADGSLKFVLENDVHHGPFPGGEAGLRPALAVVTTRVSLDPQLQEKLRTVLGGFPDSPLMTGTTVFHLSGSGESRMKVPPFRQTFGSGKPVTVDWRGLAGESTFSHDFKQFTGSWQSPGLSLDAADGEFRLDDLGATFDLHEDISGLFLGDLSYRVGAIDFSARDAAEPFQISLSDLTLRSEMQAAGEMVNGRGRFDLKRAVVGGVEYGPGGLEVHLRHLDAASLARMQQVARGMQAEMPALSAQEAAGRMLESYTQVMNGLIARSPEFEISELFFRAPDGELHGTAKIAIDGTIAAKGIPGSLPAAITASADFSITESLLHRLLAATIRKDLDKAAAGSQPLPNAVALDRSAAEQAGQRLQALVDQNILMRSGDQLRLSASYHPGEATLNGRPIPVPVAGK